MEARLDIARRATARWMPTSRRIVEYARAFSAADLTAPLESAFANTMLDSIASLVSGFESEPVRICARLARTTRGDLESTVLGYGIVTTPELAAYANSSMIRHTDFNDHTSDMIGGILAVGEAVHASGTDVMMAIILAYQVYGALSAPAAARKASTRASTTRPPAAVAAGKLLGLNEDQLANALSLALDDARAAARQPQRHAVDAEGLRDRRRGAQRRVRGAGRTRGHDGAGRAVRGTRRAVGQDHGSVSAAALAARHRRTASALNNIIKRYPAEAYTLAVHQSVIPEVRKWTQRRRHRRDSRRAELRRLARDRGSAEVGPAQPRDRRPQPPLRNRPGARRRRDLDRLLRPDKLMEPAVRALMDKITASVNPDYSYHGQVRMTVRTKAGAELVREIGKEQHRHQPGDAGHARRDRGQVQPRVHVHESLGRAAPAGVRAVVESAQRATTSPSRSRTLPGSARRHRSDAKLTPEPREGNAQPASMCASFEVCDSR